MKKSNNERKRKTEQTLESIANELMVLLPKHPDATDEEVTNYLIAEKGLSDAEINAVNKRVLLLRKKLKQGKQKMQLEQIVKEVKDLVSKYPNAEDAEIVNYLKSEKGLDDDEITLVYKRLLLEKGTSQDKQKRSRVQALRKADKNHKPKNVKVVDDIDHSKLLNDDDKKNLHLLEEEVDAKVDEEVKDQCS